MDNSINNKGNNKMIKENYLKQHNDQQEDLGMNRIEGDQPKMRKQNKEQKMVNTKNTEDVKGEK